MSESPLGKPAEIYRPFTADEVEVLEGFVGSVRAMAEMSFFEQVPKTATVTFDEHGLRSEMEEPDREAVLAAVTIFRQVYNHKEAYSFKKAMELLKRSVYDRNSDLRDEALEQLKGHLASEKKALREGVGVGFTFEGPEGESEDVDTRKLIDVYFHGLFFHAGTKKSDLAKKLDEMPPFPRYTLYSVMLVLRNVYWAAANAAEQPLKTPELLPTG